MELIAPAGSQEAVAAAVQNGADAIYLALGGRTVGRGDNSFADDEFEYAARYCRVRGCLVYAAIDTLVTDDEMHEAASLAERAARLGADGIIVKDAGLLRVLSRAAPGLKLIADLSFGIDSPDAAIIATAMGASRVTLARELSFARIKEIAQSVPTELVVSVHGELCSGKSGNCYFSALAGGVSANRTACPRPCRASFSMGGRIDEYPLSLRDNCLIHHLDELRNIGVQAIMIEGREKRPEYSAAITELYSSVMHGTREPSDLQLIDELFSDYGLTDAFFSGIKDSALFPTDRPPQNPNPRVYTDIRRGYFGREIRRVPVKIYALVRDGEFALGAEDVLGNRAEIRGNPPQRSHLQSLTSAALERALYRTGGTPYLVESVSSIVEPGLYIANDELESMRRELLTRLSDSRMSLKDLRFGSIPPLPSESPQAPLPKINFEIRTAAQLSPRLAELRPHVLYVPLDVYVEAFEATAPFRDVGTGIVVITPHTIDGGEESAEIQNLLRRARSLGAREALIRSLGHMRFAANEGFLLRADYPLNIYNSYSLKTIEEIGFLSATLSFELSLEKIKTMSKSIDSELIVYGRLPLMVTEHCVINRSLGRHACRNLNNLSGPEGALYPVMREFGCRNVIYSSRKLYLADRRSDYESSGLWGVRLMFTTETPHECLRVAKSYISGDDYMPNGLTRGLYYAN